MAPLSPPGTDRPWRGVCDGGVRGQAWVTHPKANGTTAYGFGDLKYPADFKTFEYVKVEAPTAVV